MFKGQPSTSVKNDGFVLAAASWGWFNDLFKMLKPMLA